MTTPVALVVGGASGIGEGTARTLAEAGWRVAIADLDDDRGTEVAGAIAGTFPDSGAHAWPCDVRDRTSVDATIDGVASTFGGLDLVVASAGYRDPAPSSEVTDESLSQMVDVQLLGVVRCARAAFPHLKRSDRASMVAVSSINARLGVPHRLAYNIAKAGLEAMVRTLAIEWAPHGIRVNAVAPSWVLTPMVQAGIDAGGLDVAALNEWLPQGRFAETHEVADVIAFLASPGASYISGQTVLIDGGMTVRGPWPSDATPTADA
jgi:NAD(P)-dependent dehydrogenase (short-subunit alcohol dehydrogenase family)